MKNTIDKWFLFQYTLESKLYWTIFFFWNHTMFEQGIHVSWVCVDRDFNFLRNLAFIYTFGVLMLEIIIGKEISRFSYGKEDQNILAYVRNTLEIWFLHSSWDKSWFLDSFSFFLGFGSLWPGMGIMEWNQRSESTGSSHCWFWVRFSWSSSSEKMCSDRFALCSTPSNGQTKHQTNCDNADVDNGSSKAETADVC